MSDTAEYYDHYLFPSTEEALVFINGWGSDYSSSPISLTHDELLEQISQRGGTAYVEDEHGYCWLVVHDLGLARDEAVYLGGYAEGIELPKRGILIQSVDQYKTGCNLPDRTHTNAREYSRQNLEQVLFGKPMRVQKTYGESIGEYAQENGELREALDDLIYAIEKVGDWDEETRVGQAIARAQRVG